MSFFSNSTHDFCRENSNRYLAMVSLIVNRPFLIIKAESYDDILFDAVEYDCEVSFFKLHTFLARKFKKILGLDNLVIYYLS